ncbi:MAG: RNA 2',3'-cyclic phosphodiesterase [Bacteroidota bacterium]
MGKRLFVAVKIRASNQLISVYKSLQEKLIIDRIKWVEYDNFHLTLKFLGDTDEQLLPEIISKIENLLKRFNQFKITLLGFGRFLKKKHTKVIWLGVEDPNKLLSLLAVKLNNNLKGLGFKIEQKEFKPHLTLGRVKYIQDEKILSDFIRFHSNKQYQEIIIDEIILFESILTSKGPIYNKLKIFKLSG